MAANGKSGNGNLSMHELATMFPPMSDEEYEGLKADIAMNGAHQPVAVWRGQIIDGRHRYQACQDLGIQAPLKYLPNDADPVSYIMSANMSRRHLTPSQRSIIAEEIRTIRPVVDMERGNNGNTTNSSTEEFRRITQADMRDQLHVGHGSIDRAAKVRRDGIKPIAEAVKVGLVSVRDAEMIVERDKETQGKALEAVKAGQARTLISAVNAMDRRELAENPPPLPTGTYRTVVIDPPWHITKSDRSVRPNQQGFDYPTMTLDEIAQLPVDELLADDGWVFLWTTQRYLPSVFNYVDDSIEPKNRVHGLLAHWGLDYRFTMVWHKPGGMQIFGLPQFDCEFVVVASKGNPMFIDRKNFSTVLEAPRAGHSVKPEEFYDLLRRVTATPRLDMFGRRDIEGFAAWGNEGELSDGVPA